MTGFEKLDCCSILYKWPCCATVPSTQAGASSAGRLQQLIAALTMLRHCLMRVLLGPLLPLWLPSCHRTVSKRYFPVKKSKAALPKDDQVCIHSVALDFAVSCLRLAQARASWSANATFASVFGCSGSFCCRPVVSGFAPCSGPERKWKATSKARSADRPASRKRKGHMLFLPPALPAEPPPRSSFALEVWKRAR